MREPSLPRRIRINSPLTCARYQSAGDSLPQAEYETRTIRLPRDASRVRPPAAWKDRPAMKVSIILDFIDHGQIALPEFQRGYVWNRDQVRSLMQSLYRRYPVGSLLAGQHRRTRQSHEEMRRWRLERSSSSSMVSSGSRRYTALYAVVHPSSLKGMLTRSRRSGSISRPRRSSSIAP
jgi:hypothetical protein